ncbi:MAG: helix-turn-helix domain-containing protein [Candidatus Moduliflexus flocculans]|nr:helix-turn-helix domain-containing protein [Candidatus Moduliflexus flocculans]
MLDHLWGDEKAVIDRTVDVHIRNLREKLGPAAAHGQEHPRRGIQGRRMKKTLFLRIFLGYAAVDRPSGRGGDALRPAARCASTTSRSGPPALERMARAARSARSRPILAAAVPAATSSALVAASRPEDGDADHGHRRRRGRSWPIRRRTPGTWRTTSIRPEIQASLARREADVHPPELDPQDRHDVPEHPDRGRRPRRRAPSG